MLSATSFQITLLTGQNSESNLQLYVLGGVFLAASAVWYLLFRTRPAVYVLAAPWIFFGLAFFLIGLPSVTSSLHGTHDALSNAATWCYAVASAAAFVFFGLNFGEEAVSFRSCHNHIVSDRLCHRVLQQRSGLCEHVWFKARNKSGLLLFGTGVIRWMVSSKVTWRLGGLWPLFGLYRSWVSSLSISSYMGCPVSLLTLHSLITHFLNMFKRLLPSIASQGSQLPQNPVPAQACSLVCVSTSYASSSLLNQLRFLGSEVLRDYWLSGVSSNICISNWIVSWSLYCSPTAVTGASCGVYQSRSIKFYFLSSHSSSESGLPWWVFWRSWVRSIPGSCRCSPSVWELQDGVRYVSWYSFPYVHSCGARCFGVLPLWPSIFLGLDLLGLTLVYRCGYGLEFSMPSKVSDLEWFCYR